MEGSCLLSIIVALHYCHVSIFEEAFNHGEGQAEAQA